MCEGCFISPSLLSPTTGENYRLSDTQICTIRYCCFFFQKEFRDLFCLYNKTFSLAENLFLEGRIPKKVCISSSWRKYGLTYFHICKCLPSKIKKEIF